ncbi:SH2 domain-containing adapter protein F-like isoform X2 [Nerophis ophidion]|uniref:SH2 domain-containing adapter protein F-like isoform X2 n=1 Tax=Nerophis ophidion TaxID=159077 RepID=UPI002AE0B2AB|nr:SH2 domain-containing adapter protein F-like isoform X2 [Nerophis ophidion]
MCACCVCCVSVTVSSTQRESARGLPHFGLSVSRQDQPTAGDFTSTRSGLLEVQQKSRHWGCERCTGSMAKWFKEHLGFKTTKAPPPAPPKPDYRHCLTGVPGAPGFQAAISGATFPAQPDILAAYKLQKELDFEDPYTPGGNVAFGCGSVNAVGAQDIKYVSPKHRLIKVETVEKNSPASGGGVTVTQAVALGSVKSPTSPPTEQDSKEKLIILEDYADPFDAEQAGGVQITTEKVTTENDGYMEPYEAQKMMAEIRSNSRGPKDGASKQLPLYDTPYEPAENGGDSDPERSRCPRESRLPQDDERPPEEYDQPWEWKKERISKAFAALLCYDCISYEGSINGTGSLPHRRKDCNSKSPTAAIDSPETLRVKTPVETPFRLSVQFDGVEKPRMSPTKDGKARPLQRHSSGCLVNTKMASADQSSNSSLGERIDPSMPLESQFWYHGAISRTDAECLLRLCKEASYLVRNSETSKNDYSLSLKSSQGFMHMKLSRTKENKYVLGQNSCPFDSVPDIIHFYSSRKLPIKGAEHMSLLYPVAIRTL